MSKVVVTANSQLSDFGIAFKVECLNLVVPVVASVPGCDSSIVFCSSLEFQTLALYFIIFESIHSLY